MNRRIVTLGLGILLGSLPGCIMFSYELTPPPLAAAAPLHMGKDCGIVFFGLGGGDLSVAEAMRQGGITHPAKISLSDNYVLIAGERCIIVEGDGPGPSAASRYPQHQ